MQTESQIRLLLNTAYFKSPKAMETEQYKRADGLRFFELKYSSEANLKSKPNVKKRILKS